MDPAQRFASLLDRPLADAHLDLLAALIGASFEPATQIATVLGELDELSARYEPTFDALMAGLFGSGLLRGNVDDYGDPRNSYLHVVLVRRVGIPISLSVVAMEVGRRMGVEVHGIGLPGHFVVRDARSGRYGDPFHAGRICSPAKIEDVWRSITRSTSALPPELLDPVPTRLILLRMLHNLKATMVARNDVNDLAVLARLRGSFPELAAERGEHARWLRHWN